MAMKISAKIDYACRAILELALHWPVASPLQAQKIAKRQKIPMKFLVHILIDLKESGYVDSIRGKNGGYVLLKKPVDVKLSDIVRHFGGLGFSESVPKTKGHVMDAMWQEVQASVNNALEGINFEDIRNKHMSQSKTVSYDI